LVPHADRRMEDQELTGLTSRRPIAAGAAAGAAYRHAKPLSRKPLAKPRVAADFRVTLRGKRIKRHPGTDG
jgi:hypothetical protein